MPGIDSVYIYNIYSWYLYMYLLGRIVAITSLNIYLNSS